MNPSAVQAPGSRAKSYGVGHETKVMEWSVVPEADAMVVAYNSIPSETEITPMKHGGADVRGKAGPRNPIRTAGPDIIFGIRRLPAPLPPPRRRGTAVGMLPPFGDQSHLRPSRCHDAAGRAPDHRTSAAARYGLLPG